MPDVCNEKQQYIQFLIQRGFQINKAPKKKVQDISVGLIKLFKDIFVIDYKKRIGFKDLYQNEIIQKNFKDLEEQIQFYEKIQTQDDFDMLQSQIQNFNKDNEEIINDNDEEQKEKLFQEDAMITSLLLQQKTDNSQQDEQTKNYSACINQYSFLIDNYMFFTSKINNLYEIRSGSSLLLLQKFFQSKLILYYITGLQQALDDKQNIFNLQIDWVNFSLSKTYKQLQERVKRDYNTWTNEFQNLLFEVKQLQEEKYPNINQYFNDEFHHDDNYFEKFPDNIKLPFRAVTMTNLKNFYLSIKEEMAEKEKFLNNKSNLKDDNKGGKKGGLETQNKVKNTNVKLNQPPQILQRNYNHFIYIEYGQKSNVLLRLAMCAAWNRIFSVKNIFNLNGNKVSYEDLIKIIHESDQDQCFKQTMQIMETYFGTLKDFSYNFM